MQVLYVVRFIISLANRTDIDVNCLNLKMNSQIIKRDGLHFEEKSLV